MKISPYLSAAYWPELISCYLSGGFDQWTPQLMVELSWMEFSSVRRLLQYLFAQYDTVSLSLMFCSLWNPLSFATPFHPCVCQRRILKRPEECCNFRNVDIKMELCSRVSPVNPLILSGAYAVMRKFYFCLFVIFLTSRFNMVCKKYFNTFNTLVSWDNVSLQEHVIK